jgi:flagellar motor component MotA
MSKKQGENMQKLPKTEQQPATIAKIVDECIEEVIDKAQIGDAPHAAYENGDMYIYLDEKSRNEIKMKIKEKILDYLGF